MKEETRRISVNRIKRWVEGEECGPVRIDIEPTACCNLKCKFCWQRNQKKLEWCDYNNILSKQRLKDIVKEAAALGVREWQIAGGWEPSANMDKTYPMLKLIKKYDMHGCITTNGVGFDRKHIKKLVEIGWDQILFSVEGPDAKTHDSLTQVNGSFKKVKRNVNLFKKWKNELNKENPSYSIHAVLNSENYDKLADMIEMGYNWGCNGVNFEPMLPWSDEGEEIKLTEKNIEILDFYIDEALDKAKELGIHTNLDDLKGKEDLLDKEEDSKEVLKKDVSEKKDLINSPCFAPWLSAEIRVSGRVVPCRLCNNDAGSPKIHNRSLEKIWFGDYFSNFRENMIKRNLPEYCSTCASGDMVDQKKLREMLKKSKVRKKIESIVKN